MLQEFGLVEYTAVDIREIALEYIQIDKTSVNVYLIRIKLC